MGEGIYREGADDRLGRRVVDWRDIGVELGGGLGVLILDGIVVRIGFV